jgi:hypothetical protein
MGVGKGALAELDVLDYRDHDAWFDVMVAAHAAGVNKDSFIAWSIGDEKYADDAEEIGQRWDSLRIGDWGRRVDARAAELDNPKYYPSIPHGPTCPVPPKATINLRSRISYWLSEISKGNEDSLFKASCIVREIISEGLLSPEVGVQLLQGAWPAKNGKSVAPLDTQHKIRRVIAAAFLKVEDKL